jgi:hypothetical protein
MEAMALQKPVVLRSYYSVMEAELTCARLVADGIEARVEGQQAVGVMPLHALALGGVRVLVAAADLAQAHQQLAVLGALFSLILLVCYGAQPLSPWGRLHRRLAIGMTLLGLSMCRRRRGCPSSTAGTSRAARPGTRHRESSARFAVEAVHVIGDEEVAAGQRARVSLDPVARLSRGSNSCIHPGGGSQDGNGSKA